MRYFWIAYLSALYLVSHFDLDAYDRAVFKLLNDNAKRGTIEWNVKTQAESPSWKPVDAPGTYSPSTTKNTSTRFIF